MLESWRAVFGISYFDSITAAAALGVIAGVWLFAFDVDPLQLLKKKTPAKCRGRE
jgi:hypothetical protein